ncbi:MAG: lactate racemase domain-containing protein [Planctomycetota bacterium]
MLASLTPETRPLTDDEVRGVLTRALGRLDLAGKRVLAIIPDSTRTAPIPLLARLLGELLDGTGGQIDFLVALGTHMPMDDVALGRLVGAEVGGGRFRGHRVFNHQWDDPATFATIGTVTAAEVEQFSHGRLSLDVPVAINRLALDYDHLVVCGPVFPHEVVGFSGGNKYFFPGIAGPEMINVTHWMGALLTSMGTIGIPDTPMRRMIDHAAAMIPTPRTNVAMVMHGSSLVGMVVGSMIGAWRAAVESSARLDIVWCDKPYRRVLAIMPEMYDDLWTGAKGMYKLEPAVADGGEVVIYAPHIDEVSYAHGHILDEIGYHVRDYFLAQWDRFKHYPWGVLAHSTHVRGTGTYVDGVETPRIRVTLATGIPAGRCERIGLGYRDPDTVDVATWEGREDEGVLVVPRAGEMLYRLKTKT